MADRPDPRDRDSWQPVSMASRLFYRRTLLATLIVVAGGMIAFTVWTLPAVKQVSAPGTTFASGALVFAPTLLVMIALALLLVAWWLGMDYGLWTSRAATADRGGGQEYEGKNIPQKDLARANVRQAQEMPRTLPRHFARHTPVSVLKERRRKQLYARRTYKGKAHMVDLTQLSASFAVITGKAGAASDSAADSVAASPRISEPPAKVSPRLPSADPGAGSVADLPAVVRPYTAVTIYLLKELVVEVENEAGIKKAVPLRRKRREDGRYIERELLAYLAALRGQPVGRDKLLEAVFAYGLSDEKYSPVNLTNQFNKCTQFLRKDINAIGAELGLPELTIIAAQREEWRLLTEECRVVDLDEVERFHATINTIGGEDFLRQEAQNACQALIDSYRGDFLAQYIEDVVRDGGDEWVDSWIRGPYTTYRDKYFLALWYRAEYWRLKAELYMGSGQAERVLQRTWYETAASLYKLYALHVPTDFTHESAMLFDLKIRQRISLGERALRASLDMYAATRNTQAGDSAYLTFARRMDMLTQGRWKPRADTLEALKRVKEQTASHRFTPRVMPHELSREEEMETRTEVI